MPAEVGKSGEKTHPVRKTPHLSGCLGSQNWVYSKLLSMALNTMYSLSFLYGMLQKGHCSAKQFFTQVVIAAGGRNRSEECPKGCTLRAKST